MPHMDLRYHVTAKSGPWHTVGHAFTPTLLRLAEAHDEVTIAGPVRLNVAVIAENRLTPLSGGDGPLAASDLFSYDLEIPAGHTWTMRPTHFDPLLRLGFNAGCSVVIRPPRPLPQPPPVQMDCDIPCDYAVGEHPESGRFFPAGCEPCPPAVPTSLPPLCSPTLAVHPARGGCVRPRYFNGMFITREDLDTDLRYVRAKLKLHNRAAGEGVVWGLNVGLDGNRVCVAPGYAVDCCGNDLVVAALYHVDARTLLCDPAAARHLGTPGPHRMNLLLEYVECPEDPRPVHGDPCSIRIERCETSRVRETARLRLVPPRDYRPRGPIHEFLEEVKSIADTAPRPVVSPLRPPIALPATPLRTTVPFHIVTRVPIQAGEPPPVDLRPIAAPDGSVGPTVSGTLPLRRWRQEQGSIDIAMVEAGWSFSAGTVTTTGPSSASPALPAPTPPFASLAWKFNVDVVAKMGAAGVTFEFQNWQAGPPSGDEAYTGTTTIALSVLFPNGQPLTDVTPQNIQESNLHVDIRTTMTGRRAEPPAWPCLDAPCGPDGERLFPVPPPWMNDHPLRPGTAADPEVLKLAAAHALLVLALARLKNAQQLTLLAPAVLQQFARDALGAKVDLTTVQLNQLSTALHRLLDAWCQGLLYPGPRCEYEPHGVVIGCARIEGGAITHVDPWGGRRWVVHYPLLTHWGEQIGLTPLDVTVGRVAAFICCIGGLPGVGVRPMAVPGLDDRFTVSAAVSPERLRATIRDARMPPVVVDAGSGFFAVGGVAEIAGRLVEGGVRPAAERTVSLLAFVGRLFSALGEGAAREGMHYVRYTSAEAPDLHLVVPESAGVVAPRKVDPAFIRDVVRAAAPRARLRVRVKPLLRPIAEKLTEELLGEVPLASIVEPTSPVAAALTARGIGNVEEVLARRPDELLGDVLNREHAAALTDALDDAERVVQRVARAINETLGQLGADRGLSSRVDLETESTRGELSTALARRLRAANVAISDDAVRAAVDRLYRPGSREA